MTEEAVVQDIKRVDLPTFEALLKENDVIERIDISSLDIYDQDLSDHTFQGCVANGAIFTDIPMEGTKWQDCQMIGTTFKSVEMSYAKFHNCTFFDKAASKGSAFRFSTLTGVEFDQCDLTLSELNRCGAYDIAFKNCRMLGINLSAADFSQSFSKTVVRSQATFTDCNLEQADLSGVNLSGCEMLDCNMYRAALAETNLSGANLQRSTLVDVDAVGANMAGADLRGCQVDGLNLMNLAKFDGLMITHDHTPGLLRELGIDVYPG
jgi:fluoroquinolone resistance protein